MKRIKEENNLRCQIGSGFDIGIYNQIINKINYKVWDQAWAKHFLLINNQLRDQIHGPIQNQVWAQVEIWNP
jgi:hypothetical protein